MRRALLTLLFFEVGVVLVAVPWSPYWDHNYFVSASPVVHAVVANNFVRGAVTGLGVVNVAVAVSEVALLFMGRLSPAMSVFAPDGTEDEA